MHSVECPKISCITIFKVYYKLNNEFTAFDKYFELLSYDLFLKKTICHLSEMVDTLSIKLKTCSNVFKCVWVLNKMKSHEIYCSFTIMMILITPYKYSQ